MGQHCRKTQNMHISLGGKSSLGEFLMIWLFIKQNCAGLACQELRIYGLLGTRGELGGRSRRCASDDEAVR